MNNYEILGISPNATEDEIKQAYRKLAREYHPDFNKGNEDKAKIEFQKIQTAYNQLMNKDKANNNDSNFYKNEYSKNPNHRNNYEKKAQKAKEDLLKQTMAFYQKSIANIEENLKISNNYVIETEKQIAQHKHDIDEYLISIRSTTTNYYTKKFNEINANTINRIFEKKRLTEQGELSEQKNILLNYIETIENKLNAYFKDIYSQNTITIQLPDEKISNLLQKISFEKIDDFLQAIESFNNILPTIITRLTESKKIYDEIQEQLNQKKSELNEFMKELNRYSTNSTTTDNTGYTDSFFNEFFDEFTDHHFKR